MVRALGTVVVAEGGGGGFGWCLVVLGGIGYNGGWNLDLTLVRGCYA